MTRSRVGRIATRIALLASFLVAVSGNTTAQEPPSEWFMMEMDPFLGPVVPVDGWAMTNVTVEIDCRAVAVQASPAEVLFDVVASPPWATVDVLAGSSVPDTSTCPFLNPLVKATVVARVVGMAPPTDPQPVAIRAVMTTNVATYTNMTVAPFEALFVSIVDSKIDGSSILEANPGDTLEVRIPVANLGNAAVTIHFALTDVPAGWTVRLPDAFVLESPIVSVNGSRAVKTVTIEIPGSFGFTNDVDTIGIRIVATHPEGTDPPSSEGRVNMLVHTKGFRMTSSRDAPGPGWPMELAAVVVAAAMMARRR